MRISWTPARRSASASNRSAPARTALRQSWNPAICRAASGKPLILSRESPSQISGVSAMAQYTRTWMRRQSPTRPSRPKEISMANRYQDIGVARQIGSYSDAVEVPPNARWLVTAGTPGLALDGSLPKDITGQAELAWTHIVTMLARAEMTVRDLVKVTHYLLRASDIPAYVKVRARFLGDARPASMLLVVPQLVRPEFLLEVEAYAARS